MIKIGPEWIIKIFILWDYYFSRKLHFLKPNLSLQIGRLMEDLMPPLQNSNTLKLADPASYPLTPRKRTIVELHSGATPVKRNKSSAPREQEALASSHTQEVGLGSEEGELQKTNSKYLHMRQHFFIFLNMTST